MRRKLYYALALTLSVLFFVLNTNDKAFALSCTSIGLVSYCDNGSSYEKLGNKIFGSDGSTYTQIGDTIYMDSEPRQIECSSTTGSNCGCEIGYVLLGKVCIKKVDNTALFNSLKNNVSSDSASKNVCSNYGKGAIQVSGKCYCNASFKWDKSISICENGYDPITKKLRTGSKDSEVIILKNFLGREGYYQGVINRDFDKELKNSLVKYQEKHMLAKKGFMDTSTIKKINRDLKTKSVEDECLQTVSKHANSMASSAEYVSNLGEQRDILRKILYGPTIDFESINKLTREQKDAYNSGSRELIDSEIRKINYKVDSIYEQSKTTMDYLLPMSINAANECENNL